VSKLGRGVYTLVIRVKRQLRKKIGKFGEYVFPPGLYVYIGSAMGEGSTSLENRLKRHFSRNKRLKWHIDYLLCDPSVELVGAIYALSERRLECELSKTIAQHPASRVIVRGFGSSDCTSGCPSHLYKIELEIHDLLKMLFKCFTSVDVEPHWIGAKNHKTFVKE